MKVVTKIILAIGTLGLVYILIRIIDFLNEYLKHLT